ncbi:dicarboxylate/amino acid:cation symporter [Anaerosalibacter bizertensis]|uniref:Dicarboxylate/amino acid:cation symporter n=1 Tax=Anaerosalibacter bizertensis TaxID=932217 RepID=A0A9Q4AE47_9FIRM|nr:dicarboxylate/amino acid:cation symporter [Anaerosalibacter bizertensis]MBV1820093.1 dicarboxylate/amino acid:cation symporter [Bacteroidales bacterium MSK.15.36]MCB5560407.1 dicarboxylate/amino acid:cation symporter [Anaerosalibacter bizertensis]MCG4565950.1 dicarboxylate/amino acid:cation symporter [Anaerosalibacter bizertensis]MCG4582227.1 dicarboxylate/amino acid:cation symporter [Anaerosalibacter bizertensis]MCG4585678.1 dicarboxylate/amino acid:cation symporter [Anaerosalibacter bizer
MSKLRDNLIVKLLLGVFLGIIIGLVSNETFIKGIITIKYILGQFIFFCVPLIIIGFIAPSITSLQSNASKMLGTTLLIAYLSSVGAALFSALAGYAIIPNLNIATNVDNLKELPEIVFKLEIPPLMSVMSALIFSIIIGLAVIWTKSEKVNGLLKEFQNIMLEIVKKMVIPILPIFIATTFAGLAYEGSITKQLPIFIEVIILVIIGHFIWLALLYGIAGLISKENPWKVAKHYGPAYLTAVGTMSSTATLPVALSSARKSEVLDKEIVDFAIPIGSTIHLCGSVLTEVFFVMTVSKILYGELPPFSSMITFIILLGVFAIGAPGVPGGTVMASLGLITGILGFDDSGVALMLTIFALQDSFGTACNITGDGAIALMLTGIFKKESNTQKIK